MQAAHVVSVLYAVEEYLEDHAGLSSFPFESWTGEAVGFGIEIGLGSRLGFV